MRFNKKLRYSLTYALAVVRFPLSCQPPCILLPARQHSFLHMASQANGACSVSPLEVHPLRPMVYFFFLETTITLPVTSREKGKGLEVAPWGSPAASDDGVPQRA